MVGEVQHGKQVRQQVRDSPDPDQRLRPDFLIITPPKTGSHWLAANFSAHPEIYVPAVKEVKYFSSFHKWFDLAWYYEQFRPGLGRLKGEASPTYSFLPVERIRWIHELMPTVKLIFLMREPMSRAWSHAKHNFRFRESSFGSCAMEFDAVPAEQWCENFVSDWPYASGDYLGQLERWLSVFPRRQIFVGFFESIRSRPQALLRDLFAFLGVTSDIDLALFPTKQKIFAGLEAELPSELNGFLHRLLHERTTKLTSLIDDKFHLTPPPSWHAILNSLAPSTEREFVPVTTTVPFASLPNAFNDNHLSKILEQEETFPSAPVVVLEGIRGHNVFFFRGRFFVVAQHTGIRDCQGMDEKELQRLVATGKCFHCYTLAEVKRHFCRARSGLPL
jgi:Sulfotransferase domain